MDETECFNRRSDRPLTIRAKKLTIRGKKFEVRLRNELIGRVPRVIEAMGSIANQ